MAGGWGGMLRLVASGVDSTRAADPSAIGKCRTEPTKRGHKAGAVEGATTHRAVLNQSARHNLTWERR